MIKRYIMLSAVLVSNIMASDTSSSSSGRALGRAGQGVHSGAGMYASKADQWHCRNRGFMQARGDGDNVSVTRGSSPIAGQVSESCVVAPIQSDAVPTEAAKFAPVRPILIGLNLPVIASMIFEGSKVCLVSCSKKLGNFCCKTRGRVTESTYGYDSESESDTTSRCFERRGPGKLK